MGSKNKINIGGLKTGIAKSWGAKIILLLICLLMGTLSAFANGIDYTDSAGYFGVPHDNVGIGSSAPGQKLDVKGTIRTTNFTMSGQSPSSGYVLTAVDSTGQTTWALPSGLSGWTITNITDVYESAGGNVGIGTTITNNAALTVMNGNVGIGTWLPATALHIVGSGTYTIARLEDQDNTYYPEYDLHRSRASFAAVQTNDSLGVILWRGYTGTSYRDGAAIVSDVEANFTSNTQHPANLEFYTAAAGDSLTSERMRITSNGNVGIGTSVPAQLLDVKGTIRTTNFTMSGQSPSSGYVLTAVDSTGQTTWALPSGLSGWTITNITDVYESAGGNVGIGTTITNNAALTVMNGNVGIGTWLPGHLLDVGNILAGTGTYIDSSGNLKSYGLITAQTGFLTYGGGDFLGTLTAESTSVLKGNVGIGTTITNAGAALSVMNGNVGIGTWVPAQLLDVKGTIRTTNFTMSGQSPLGGYVLTASDSYGDTTWAVPGVVGGWTITNTTDVYETAGGNVGIGTTITNQSALSIMSGNVGIGTWVPGEALDMNGNIRILSGGLIISNVSNGGIGFAGDNPISWGYGFTYISGQGYEDANDYLAFYTNLINRFNIDINGNVGIGTTVVVGGMSVMNGNVGIGTWVPGQLLDVKGTVRMTSLSMTGGAMGNGYVLVGNSVGLGTWMPTSSLPVSGQWTTTNITDIYQNLGGNVGIGTIITNNAALTVMNGNVGIGTWLPTATLNIAGTVALTPAAVVNVSAGTTIPVTRGIVRIAGNGGPVTVTAATVIAPGSDGEEVVILGTDSTNTATLISGSNNLQLSNGVPFTFNKGSMMSLIYDAVNAKWVELTRSSN